MSASALKYLAAVFMLCDHTAILLAAGPLLTGSGGDLVYYLMRCFGRISFPIFLFFVAEGCHKTGSLPRYLMRLGIFAAVTEIPFRLFTGNLGGSILLTFLLGALAVYGFERLRTREVPLALASVPLLAACILAIVLNTDYGFPAVLLLFALYLCGEDKRRRLVCLSAGLALLYLVYEPVTALLTYLPVLWGPMVGEYLLSVMPLQVLFFLFSMVAVALLARYSGARGGGSRWFFYVFYPAHLTLLFLLSLLY